MPDPAHSQAVFCRIWPVAAKWLEHAIERDASGVFCYRRKAMQAYAEQILSARKRLGLSRAAAAIKLGVSPRQLARYEQGESPIPLTLAVSLAEALGTSIDAMIGRDVPLDLAVEVYGRRFTLGAGADHRLAAGLVAPAIGADQLAEAIAVIQAAGAEARPPSKRRGNPPTSA